MSTNFFKKLLLASIPFVITINSSLVVAVSTDMGASFKVIGESDLQIINSEINVPVTNIGYTTRYIDFNSIFEVNDFTGLGEGWNVKIGCDQVANQEHKFYPGSLTVTDIEVVAKPMTSSANDIEKTYGVIDSTSNTNPLTALRAEVGEGMGSYDVGLSLRLKINPIDSKLYAGTYNANILITVCSGP